MWTVAQLAADLAAGRTTSRQLTEKALARIADPAGEGARAFIKVYREAALAQADYADSLRKRCFAVHLDKGARSFARRIGDASKRLFSELTARGAARGQVRCELRYSPHTPIVCAI